MFVELFPRFKVVEVNRSYALTAGHVIAQQPAYKQSTAHSATTGYIKTTTVNTLDGTVYDVLENGVICGLNSAGEVINYAASACAQPCLVMNDELTTSPIEGLDQYCEILEEEGTEKVTYPRVLPLYLGDCFTTNNYKEDVEDAVAAKVTNGVLELQTAADKDSLFTAEATTLPAGQKAYRFVFVGKTVAE